MAWFKVDDRAHSHPKVMAAGTAAYGLWSRCGSYCSEHLTNGVVPKSVARSYGTPAMARRLVEVKLWHTAGHDCPRCPQPGKGDYVMHDYLDFNPSREEVEEEREAARERMRRRRRSPDVRPNTTPNNGAGKPGKAVTNSHHEPKTEFGTNGSDRSKNFGNTTEPENETPGDSAETPDGSGNVRPNTHRTSDGVRGPRPRPRSSYGTLSARAPDTSTGNRPEDRAGEGDITNTPHALVLNTTDATPDEARVLLDRVRAELNPRGPGLLRTMGANGDLQALLDDTRTKIAAPRTRPRDEWLYRQ